MLNNKIISFIIVTQITQQIKLKSQAHKVSDLKLLLMNRLCCYQSLTYSVNSDL